MKPSLDSISIAFLLLMLFTDGHNAAPGQTQEKNNTSAQASSSARPGSATSSVGVHDGVACILTPDELTRLHGRPQLKSLTQEGAENIVLPVSAAIDDLESKNTIDKTTADDLKSKLTANALIGLDSTQALDKVRGLTTLALKNPTNQTSHASAQTTQAANAIVDAAVKASADIFAPPPDVACSMSLLTFRETSDIFGLRIAREYVAVQVIVRNLNDADEFLLHDVQLAVDTDPCGGFAQFDGGRDRLLVRAVALRNQFTDPRNWAVRILEGVGTVASSAVGFASHDYSLGLGVYNSVTPAVKAIFPDYTIDQLNRISDLSFTSSGQTRTIVGKNGVAMFVTFFPSRPLEQAWWISDAGSIPSPSSPDSAMSSPECRQQEAARGAHFGSSLDSRDGAPADSSPLGSTNSSKSTSGSPGNNPSATWSAGGKSAVSGQTPQFNPRPIAYEKWRPNALLEFRRHTFVVVAGVHITPENDLLPSIATLSCPESNGFVNLGSTVPSKATDETPAPDKTATEKPAPADAARSGAASNKSADASNNEDTKHPQGTNTNATESTNQQDGHAGTAANAPNPALSCNISGKNLDKVVKLRLRDAKESLDPVTADGSVHIQSGDSSSGTVSFTLADLEKLQGDTYNVMLIDNASTIEKTSGEVLKFTPSISKSDPNSIDKNVKSFSLTVSGTRLDLVKDVDLTSPGKVPVILKIDSQDATELKVSYKGTKALDSGSYRMSLRLQDGTPVQGLTNDVVTVK